MKLFKELLNPVPDNCTVQLVVNESDLRSIIEGIISDTIVKYDENNKKEKYLTTDEVMEILKVTRPTLWRWAKDHYLVPIKVGKRTLYRESDVSKLIEMQ